MNDDQLTRLTERLEQVETHLVRIERLLSIGFAEQVQARRDAKDMGDDVSVEILSLALAWVPAGELKRAVVKQSGQSARTVERRLGQLVALGALETHGRTSSVEYRNTGRFG